MASVRRAACSSLLASLLFIAMAIFALAAVAMGAGETDPDAERVKGPADCPMACATKLTTNIMETVKCYIACMGGGGGGGGGGVFVLADNVAKGAEEPGRPDPEHVGASPFDCPLECSTKLTSFIMETIQCYIACMGGGGGGGGGGEGELSAVEEETRGSCDA